MLHTRDIVSQFLCVVIMMALHLNIACADEKQRQTTTPTDATRNSPSKASEELARQFFLEGLKERDAGNLKKACEFFAGSYGAHARRNAAFQLANCLEQEGRTRGAQRMFEIVAGMAKREGDPDAAAEALERAKALDARHSTIVIHVSPKAQDVRHLSVFIDGNLVRPADWNGTHNIVDAGKHTITASAPNHKPYSVDVVVENATRTRHVDIPVLAKLYNVSMPVESNPRVSRKATALEIGLMVGSGTVLFGGMVALGSYYKGYAPQSTYNALEIVGVSAISAGVVGFAWATCSFVMHKSARSAANLTPWLTNTSTGFILTQPF